MDTNKYEQAVEDYITGGDTLREIAKKHHVHRYALSCMLRKQGHKTKRDIDPICELAIKEYLYDLNTSITGLCKKYDISKNALSNRLKNKKIPIRRRKYNYNESHFHEINYEWKAYWLGFIAADGHIYKSKKQLSILLKRTDKNHLYKFANIFGVPVSDGKSFDIRTKKTYYNSRVVLSSKKLVKDVIDKGVTLNKTISLNGDIFGCVTEELLPHFIRGYFDGDGGVSRGHKKEINISFVGTKIFLTKLRDVLIDRVGLNRVKVTDLNTYAYLLWGGNYQLRHLYYWLYKDASIFLERKEKLFKSVFNNNNRTSSYRGVSWDSTHKRWQSKICVNKTVTHLGFFSDEKKAAIAYNNAIDKYLLPVSKKSIIDF